MRRSKLAVATAPAEPVVVTQDDVLTPLLARSVNPAMSEVPSPGSVVIGQLDVVDEQGRPRVSWEGAPCTILATSLVPLSGSDVGRKVALSFPGNSAAPIVLGMIWQPIAPAEPVTAELDGEAVELALSAKKSLTLHCGKASITLTADGQILLRGTYISSHSSGTQRIKGAAVRIN